jgi:2-oxo-hept-3-ene-1,7-dioate hydratase
MMSDADRNKAADILVAAEKDRKQAVQLSKTWPGITMEDAYAISPEVAKRKIAAGARLIGHKVGSPPRRCSVRRRSTSRITGTSSTIR